MEFPWKFAKINIFFARRFNGLIETSDLSREQLDDLENWSQSAPEFFGNRLDGFSVKVKRSGPGDATPD